MQRLQARAGNTAVQTVLPKVGATATASNNKIDKNAVTSPPGKAGTMRLTLQGTKHEVGIDTFTFGGSVARDATGQAQHRPRFDQITISRNSDDLTPMLMHAFSTNTILSALEVELIEAPTAGQPGDTFSYSFTSARLSAIHTAGGAGPGTESLAIAFGGYSMAGPPPKAQAQQGGPGAAGEMTLAGLGGAKDGAFGLASVGWKLDTPTDRATGQAMGKMRAHQVIVTKELDAHSPALLEAMANNADLPSAKLRLTGSAAGVAGPKASGSELDLTGVRVDSIQQAGGAQPMETVALSFAQFDLGTDASKAAADPDAPAQLSVRSPKGGSWAAPVLTWEWGARSPTDLATGQASGKRQLQEFKLTVPSGPPTARFIEALQNNEDLTTVLLTPKSGPGYALSQGRVAGIDIAAGADAKTTTVNMTYRTIAQAAGATEFQDNWDADDSSAGSAGSAAAKGDAGTPGPGVAGHMRITFDKQECVLPIESFSLGVAAKRYADGRAAGAAQVSMAEVTRQADGRSPLFFAALSRNQSFSNVTVEVVQPATKTEPAGTFTYGFGGARVAGISQSGGAGGSTERLSLAFGSMSMAAPPLAKGAHETSTAVDPKDAGRMQLVGVGIGGSGSADFGVSAAEWGGQSPRDAATGQASGRVRMRQVTITKPLDRLSPMLQHALMNNAEITSGSLQVAGATTRLEGVRVDAIQQTSTGHPSERVSFSFEGQEVEGGARNLPDAPATMTIDLAKQGRIEAPVLRWDWGATAPTDAATGQASGKRRLLPFTVAVPTGPASARFLGALQNNELVTTAKLTPKSGIAYVLSGASVIDVKTTAGGGTSETVVEFVYRTVEASSGNKAFADSVEPGS